MGTLAICVASVRHLSTAVPAAKSRVAKGGKAERWIRHLAWNYCPHCCLRGSPLRDSSRPFEDGRFLAGEVPAINTTYIEHCFVVTGW